MTLTRYGIREWGGGGLIAIVLVLGCFLLAKYVSMVAGISLGSFVLLVWLAVAAFFRNPHRTPPDNVDFILSPADGEVRDITMVDDFTQEPFDGKALRVGIFLSVLNVHVNRAPVKFNVVSKLYRPGKYLDARDKNCAKENEAMTIAGEGEVSGVTFPMAIRQISGAIARRIVCPVQPGKVIPRAKIYGMIKFGSRTELYLPQDDRFELLVKPGDKVKAGISVIARIKTAAVEVPAEKLPETDEKSDSQEVNNG